MKKIALVVLYFGSLPQYTTLFFESLKRNPSIDLIMFTDRPVGYDGKNLKVYRTTFSDMINRIQDCFDFKIVCDRPYKLCDYRPAYGYIFDKELNEYDFWGHCDLDMILGDVRAFLPDNILNRYDKIYQHGHMSLYKNTRENNLRFMSNAGMDYRKVFTTPISCVFDEVEGIQKKYDLLGVPTYKKRDCADISPWHDSFQRVESYLAEDEKDGFNFRQQVFYWQNGHLQRAYVKENAVMSDEFNYLHFQRRTMPFKEIDIIDGAFYITRTGIIKKESNEVPTVEMIKGLNDARTFGEIKKIMEHKQYVWKRRMNKYLLNK